MDGPAHQRIFARTRLAPTPSGYLHLGNIFSFVLTVALARNTDAKILLRIDDLDKERAKPAYLQDVFETLQFLQLPYDEGPRDALDFTARYSQAHRMELYQQALAQLEKHPEVFACTCSRTQMQQASTDGGYPGTCRYKGLPLHTPGAAWRVRTPDDVTIAVRTLKGVEAVQGFPPAIRDFVVRKRDGTAAYQLASVVDDVHFGVDLVVRGADLWPSTLAQRYLSSLIGLPQFADVAFLHHTLIRSLDGTKLSKSAGSTSVYGLRNNGKTKAEIYQMIAQWCGADVPVPDWQTLAEVLVPHFLNGK